MMGSITHQLKKKKKKAEACKPFLFLFMNILEQMQLGSEKGSVGSGQCEIWTQQWALECKLDQTHS